MLRLVRHVAAKVSPNYAMPCGVVLLVKLLQKDEKQKRLVGTADAREELQLQTCSTFLTKAAISFSMLNLSIAWMAKSTASCCMSSDMSTFFITAFFSDMLALFTAQRRRETHFSPHSSCRLHLSCTTPVPPVPQLALLSSFTGCWQESTCFILLKKKQTQCYLTAVENKKPNLR